MLEAKKLLEKFNWPKKSNDEKRPSARLIGVAILLVIIFLVVISIVVFEINHQDRFFPGSKIGLINLSGLTRQEAENKLQASIDSIEETSIAAKLINDGGEKIVEIDFPASVDVAKPVIIVDLPKTMEVNFQIGHSGNLLTDLLNQYLVAAGLRKMAAAITINKDYLITTLNSQLSPEIVNSSSSKPEINCENNHCNIVLLNESNGLGYDFERGIADWQVELGELKTAPIILRRQVLAPEVTRNEAEKLLPELEQIFVASGTPVFKSGDQTWLLDKKQLAKMVAFDKYSNKVIISIDQSEFNAWFKANIAKNIDVAAQDATVEMASGTISKLIAQRAGKKADIEKAYNDLIGFYRQKNYKDIVVDVKVDEQAPEVTMGNINDLGIKEIIGTGESNFAGSPTNRIKNIKNGAAKLHGKIIKPGEEFSVMQNVLPVDAENGYFTEMVIKGNKTMAEYGGGLCQIGTTMFRAALASGLPIIERTNHSYNVAYYLENGLPGVDATIYDPKPDMKFKNDTGNYILIQARIAGTKLYFDFWGTKDGRTASRTKPKVWGWKSPAATKYIETTDLKLGEKKCTETAHKGVSASFDYIVSYPDGHTATSTFTSVYKPWQEVCLIGVSSLSTASSTVTGQ